MSRLRILILFLFFLVFDGNSSAFDFSPPYLIDTTQSPRSVSFENPTGDKGRGGREASNLGVGRKGAPARDLEPGEEVQLCDLMGPGIIRHVWITTRNSPGNLRGLVLRAYWDGQDHPSIECPLGDFMGLGHGKTTSYFSAVHSVGPKAAMNFWLPMPFQQSARLTLTNERKVRSRLYYQVDYTQEESLAPSTGSLHTLFRRENPTIPKKDFEILPKRTGTGRYIGCVLGIRSLNSNWWGEGEVKIYLDGDTDFPTICGTGSEDYVGLSWGMQETPQFYQGCNLNRNGFVSMYRWHLPDPIVWKKDIRVTIQQLGWIPNGYEDRQDDWSVATFWYEPIPSAPLPPLPSLENRTADLPLFNPLEERIGKITPIEAAHLVENLIEDCQVEKVVVDEELGLPLYSVQGTIDGERFDAAVDAERSRVLSVEKGGEEVYRWEGILVSGHRGANRSAPENTVASTKKSGGLWCRYHRNGHSPDQGWTPGSAA